MLSAADRQAIGGHAAIIERYEAERGREESRLLAPHQERGRKLWERLHDGASSLVRPAHFAGPADIFWEDPSIREEAFEIMKGVNAGLAAFDEAHRPQIDPYDTPRKLVAWIDDKLDWLGMRRAALLSHTDTGREVLKQRGWEHRPEGPPSYPTDEVRDHYRDARGRALAFIRLAPGLLAELPESADPVIGLQNIRACFAPMIETSEADPTASAEPPPSDVASEHVDVPKVRLTGPLYIKKAYELLSQIRDQVRELGRFWTHQGYPWNGVGVLLWGAIREYEALCAAGFEGKLRATADEIHAMTWAISIIRRLPGEADQFRVEGFDALRTLTEPDKLEALDEIVAKLTPPPPIAAYLADVDGAREEWENSCQWRKELRLRDPDADPPYGEDYKNYRRRLEEAESRHFPVLDPRTGAGLNTPPRLWRWIVSRLELWENVEPTGVAMGLGSPHPCWDDLVRTYGQLHRLGLPGALRPPYVRTMTEREAMDEMHSIAHSIREREVDASGSPRGAWGRSSPPAGAPSVPILSPRGRTALPAPDDRSGESTDTLDEQGKGRDRLTSNDDAGLTEAEITTRLLKEGRRLNAQLVDFMVGRKSATYEEIARAVHDHEDTSGGTIGKNVSRTNEKLTEYGSRLRFRCASSRVFREVSPE